MSDERSDRHLEDPVDTPGDAAITEPVDATDDGAIEEPAGQPETPRFARFDPSQSGRLNPREVEALTQLQQVLAEDVSISLGAVMGVGVEVEFVSVDQIEYSHFLEQLEESSYLAAVHMDPSETRALVKIEPALAFPVIDLLLGGEGKPGFPSREMTDIEVQVLETTVGAIVRDLQRTVSTVFECGVTLEERVPAAEALQVMPPRERALALSFEVKMPEATGKFQFLWPALVSNAILEALLLRTSYRQQRSPAETSEALREHLMNTRFPVELVLPDMPIHAGNLLGLQVGQILTLPHAIEDDAVLRIGNREVFWALPVRGSMTRGALVKERILTNSGSGDDRS